jgi:hypothetical protein
MDGTGTALPVSDWRLRKQGSGSGIYCPCLEGDLATPGNLVLIGDC